MTKRAFIIMIVQLLAIVAWTAEGFSAPQPKPPPRLQPHVVVVPVVDAVTRRHAVAATTAAVLLSLLTAPSPSRAAATTTASSTAVITPVEKDRIATGYAQIQYLLDNFEQETTVCRENGGECKRNADAIRKALGLRSTTDPLFQIEKVFAKVKNMEEIDMDKLDAFYTAAEDWNSATNMSNSMAFISQFGEYNPGGGVDEVLKYLLESKKQVILARDSLKTIMNSLDIPIP